MCRTANCFRQQKSRSHGRFLFSWLRPAVPHSGPCSVTFLFSFNSWPVSKPLPHRGWQIRASWCIDVLVSFPNNVPVLWDPICRLPSCKGFLSHHCRKSQFLSSFHLAYVVFLPYPVSFLSALHSLFSVRGVFTIHGLSFAVKKEIKKHTAIRQNELPRFPLPLQTDKKSMHGRLFFYKIRRFLYNHYNNKKYDK